MFSFGVPVLDFEQASVIRFFHFLCDTKIRLEKLIHVVCTSLDLKTQSSI